PSIADQLAACQQRIRELEQRDTERQAVIAQQQELIASYQEQLAKAAEQLRFFKRAMFGQRRERYAPSPDQRLLFVPEVVQGLDAQRQNSGNANADLPPPRTRRKPGRPRITFPQFWEHRRTDYPLSDAELPCGCCGQQRVITRTHVTKRLEMEEAKLYVVEEVRYTYGCSHCHDGSQMVTTQRPPQAVEKSPFGPSVLAWLVTWKFLHHLPVYRQQELLLGPLKRWLSRALLCGLLSRTAQALRPLERLIRQQVLASIVINADETEVRMLKPGHGKTIKGYLSGYAGDADHRYVFYDFRPSRSRDGPEEMLENYRGYLQTDGYVVYTSLVRHSEGRLVDVACWAHGRRGFEEAIPTTSHPLVHEAMIWTQQLYDIEDRAREMSADDRGALRHAEALPILMRMKARFDEVRPTLRPTASLAEAIDYVLNRWDAFVRYTSDGRIQIDNNVIERLLRPVAIGRKNYLFFGSEKGGKTAATLYTLVQSARRNNVDVWPYLTDVLRRIAAIAPGDTAALEALLPDRWVATHAEHRLEQREEESREVQARRRHKRAARRAAVIA
ncbi:MAG: IS66 family transposase, partial [Thermoguttaceae bacterium]